MSSRLAWMAAFTLEVSSATSFLYFWFSFSSSVTFAFTMAMDSFIFGTWSFRSRMFCSRISSGSSAAEIIQPNIERNARRILCHIGESLREGEAKPQLVQAGKDGTGRNAPRLRCPRGGLSRLGQGLREEGAARAGGGSGQ